MNVVATGLPGVVIVEPRVFRDERGFFLESYNEQRFREAGLPTEFCQDNHSRSVRGVVRGLHCQVAHPQGKLVSVAHGAIFDVAVDVRRGSPHFGRWVGVHLTGEDGRALWIPPGFAHGFCAVSDVADVTYKCTGLYHPEDECGVMWNDPGIGIEWPVRDAIVSAKDAQCAPLHAGRRDLPAFP